MADRPGTDGRACAHRAAGQAARTAYGRLVAYLATRTGDVAAAEDALADAFTAALATWPDRGVPERPEAWLLQVARRKLTDAARRAQTRRVHEPDLILAIEEAAMPRAPDVIADERLSLLFACAHPAIDAAIRTALMLQTVLGLDAARIASVFLVSPAAMAQRLVRAKTKIKAAGIPFALPERKEWPARMAAVLNAIYGAYTAGWDAGDGGDNALAGEAEWLARLTCELSPDHAEAAGLLALILHCEARRPARTSGYVPLSEQDTSLWDATLIEAAEDQLRRASGLGPPGRFQTEAAIQSVHAERRITGVTNWTALLALYTALVRMSPTVGAQVARAAVLFEVEGAAAALETLDSLPAQRIGTYAPYWATRAHILARSGQGGAADDAYGRAIALTRPGAAQDYLARRRAALRS